MKIPLEIRLVHEGRIAVTLLSGLHAPRLGFDRASFPVNSTSNCHWICNYAGNPRRNIRAVSLDESDIARLVPEAIFTKVWIFRNDNKSDGACNSLIRVESPRCIDQSRCPGNSSARRRSIRDYGKHLHRRGHDYRPSLNSRHNFCRT